MADNATPESAETQALPQWLQRLAQEVPGWTLQEMPAARLKTLHTLLDRRRLDLAVRACGGNGQGLATAAMIAAERGGPLFEVPTALVAFVVTFDGAEELPLDAVLPPIAVAAELRSALARAGFPVQCVHLDPNLYPIETLPMLEPQMVRRYVRHLIDGQRSAFAELRSDLPGEPSRGPVRAALVFALVETEDGWRAPSLYRAAAPCDRQLGEALDAMLRPRIGRAVLRASAPAPGGQAARVAIMHMLRTSMRALLAPTLQGATGTDGVTRTPFYACPLIRTSPEGVYIRMILHDKQMEARWSAEFPRPVALAHGPSVILQHICSLVSELGLSLELPSPRRPASSSM